MPRPTLSAALVALLTPGLLVAGLGTPSAAATPPVVLETGSTPDTRPFPDDAFTVADAAQLTGRRVALPTAGCACHSSGLNVKSFLKAVHVITYDRAALLEVARHVEVFAESEDLPSHGAAVTRRFSGEDPSRRSAVVE